MAKLQQKGPGVPLLCGVFQTGAANSAETAEKAELATAAPA